MEKEQNRSQHNDISRLLGELKQIDPPGDFDVRVRARIAQGKPSTRRSWFPATAGVAAAAVMMAAGYVGFNSYSSQQSVQQAKAPTSIEPVIERPPVNTSVPIQNEPPRGSIAATQPAEENDIIPPRAPEAVRPKAPDREQGGGSIDLSSKEGKRILPRGLSTAPKVNANISLVEQGGIPIGDVLKHLGLDAAPEDAGWRVTSVTGAAERSGFKTGDVIEAINDRSLVKRTSLTGTVSSKTVRVRRDGKVIVVTLKP